MLSTIREKIQGWFATVVVLIIGIPFAFWGIDSYFNADSSLIVAEVGDAEISQQAYRDALERQRQAMRQFLGRNADPRMFETPAFKTQVINQLADEILIARYAHDAGYALSDQSLRQKIREIPQFQGPAGFDAKQYEEVLRGSGLSVAAFERNMREDAMAAQIRAGFMQAIVPAAAVERLVQLQTQKRELSYIVVAPEKLTETVKAPEELINNYYESHSDEFKTPERVRVEYIRLSADALMKKLTITDEDLRKLYEEEMNRFVTPEERRASHILIEVDAKAPEAEQKKALAIAQDLHKQIVKGADFAALARKHSKDPGSAGKGGDLGFSKKGAFVPEFERALFALKRGGVTEPIKTQYGYHIIKLVDIKPEVRKSFAQVRPELETMLRTRKAEERFFELSQTFQNSVYEHPESLRPAAEALGLQVQQSEWFTRAGGAGIATNSKVVEAAFDPEVLAQQRNSDAIELAPTDFVALRVVAREPVAKLPLAEVKPQIIARLKRELAEAEAKKLGAALLERARKGEALATLAREPGVNYVAGKTITRRDPQGVDGRIVESAFKAARPGNGAPVYEGIDLGAQGFAIIAVTRVEEGVATNPDPSLKTQAQTTLERRDTVESYEAFMAGLRKAASIKIYNDRL